MTDKIKQLLTDIERSEDVLRRLTTGRTNLTKKNRRTVQLSINNDAVRHGELGSEETKELQDLLEIWLERERAKHTDLLHTARVIEDLLMEP